MKKLLLGLALCSSVACAHPLKENEIVYLDNTNMEELTLHQFYEIAALNSIQFNSAECTYDMVTDKEKSLEDISYWADYLAHQMIIERAAYTTLDYITILDKYAANYAKITFLECSESEHSSNENEEDLKRWAEWAFSLAHKLTADS